jgi:penicillin-binding protein 1B
VSDSLTKPNPYSKLRPMIIRKITRRVPIVAKAHKKLLKIALIVVGVVFLIGLIIVLRFAYKADQLIEAHLNSTHRWSLPSTIYGEAPVLYEGMAMQEKSLVQYLQRLNYQRTDAGEIKTGEYKVLKDTVSFKKHQFFSTQGKLFPVQAQFGKSGLTKLTNLDTKEGIVAYELEPIPISDLFGSEWEKRTLVQYNEIPKCLIQAVVAIEDRRFYKHHGVDYIAVIRAVWNDLIVKKQFQGGSTITQQLVKNFYLTPERSLKRKLSEVMMAWLIERKQTKEQILELYLNEIYLGQRGSLSIAGVGEASRLMFRKDVQNITVPEAALMAGMIQAPNAYNPYRHPDEAKKRRDTVLLAMQGMGYITEKDYKAYTASPIVVYPIDTRINLAPYFGDIVKAQLLAKYDPHTIYTQNLHIFTTLDPDMQRYAEEALTAGLDDIDKLRFKRIKQHVQGCLIAIEPQTGYIRAFVGGRSFSKSQFDRISQAVRQPGSVFKPVVYAEAFEEAFNSPNIVFTPATLVPDEPWLLKYANQEWEPKNYDGQYHGIVTLRMALSQSMNIATARLAMAVGLPKIASLGEKLGFPTVKPYPSIALGTFEVSPWQVAEAYTVFANGGVKTELLSIKKVTDADGKTLQRSQIEVKRILHAQTAYLITDMLKTVMQRGTAAAVSRWGFTRPAAGKTGTTDEYRDAWFVGYTPNLLCVVWTGYDDNTPIKMTGGQAALPIWVRFMLKATQNQTADDFVSPNGIVARMIDPTTGLLASDQCPDGVPEIFIQGTEPTQTCNSDSERWYSLSPASWWGIGESPEEAEVPVATATQGEKADPAVDKEITPDQRARTKEEPNWWEQDDQYKQGPNKPEKKPPQEQPNQKPPH